MNLITKNYNGIAIDFNTEESIYINATQIAKHFNKEVKDWLKTNQTQEYLKEFEKEKIVYPNMTKYLPFVYDNTACLTSQKCFILTKNNDSNFDLKYLLAIFNSKLMDYYFKTIGATLGKSGYEMSKIFIEKLPIPKIPENEQIPFIEKADIMIELNKKFIKKKNKFLNRLKGLGINKPSKKLENFYTLDFNELIKELKKQKIKLPLKEQDEWEDYFNDYKNELNEILSEIEKTDKEIDKMVYKLYNLTDEEINIIENIN